ncbi:MAG: HD-GYP domain-containing protein, partial [Candidatus Omnitrophota bacterium]|nr:HD-GYP domain-containing protein [Candidatus Omnitrophota bacterium]
LILGAKEVGRGNLNFKVKIQSKDEIGELADTFNKMTDGIQKTQVKLQQYYLDTIRSLARALEAKDSYTKGHSQRVSEYALNLAKCLRLNQEEIKLLEELSILHDIGKIGIPEKVLNKQGPLSEEEWRLIKKHPEIGEDILKHIEFLKPGISIVSHHHERPDGKGYPHGLKKEKISLLASIVAIADAYDAMTSDRPYRKAFAKDEAIAMIEKNTGTQFDNRVVEAFIEYLHTQTND